MGDGEFLGVDIGNNGSYRRLKNWDKQDADGGWHYETFTLTGDDISNAFTIRFFGITRNAFTTVAIDNVMIAATPGSVVVEPEPTEEPEEDDTEEPAEPEEEPEPAEDGEGGLGDFFSFFDTPTQEQPAEEEPEEPEDDTQEQPEEPEPEEPEDDPQTAHPDLAVTDATATPLSLQSSYIITVQAKITNTGTAPAETETVQIYRHVRKTNNPKTGGTRERGTAATGTLATGNAVTVTSTHTAPTVSETKRYYYYVCVDTLPEEQNTNNNCSPTPAEVVVRVKPEDPGPPYENCHFAPERSTPMGGDAMKVQDFDYDFGTTSCGTITLGGLETVTGEQGFVASVHVISGAFYPESYTRIDAFVGHSRYKHSHKIKYFLGKVFKMPGFRTEGEKKVLNVDAAFVAYPHPKTPGCSLTWSGDEEEFCLDPGHSDYIERIVPLTVRGKNGKTHKVIGSKEPTVGLDMRVIGSVSGIPTNSTVSEGRILYNKGNHYEYSYHSFIDKLPMSGDSGGPVHTVPDTAGNVHILGLMVGVYPITNEEWGLVFDSWGDVTEGLGLKPIGR